MSNGFNIIVFSKDRAMQLDLFLRSFYHFVEDAPRYTITVLYTYSKKDLGVAYDLLIDKSPALFYKERDFKSDLIGLVTDVPYTVFFVDDNIFKCSVNLYDEQMDIFNSYQNIVCRSLRLHRNLSYCYPARVKMTPPVFDDAGMFIWRGQKGDYGYPFSVDGHIFRTSLIKEMVITLDYTNPNTFEGDMQHWKTTQDYMICYDDSIIMNNPVNKVQNVNDNIHGNVSAEWLNEKFLQGKRIKLEPFVGFKNTSCHQELPIILEDA